MTIKQELFNSFIKGIGKTVGTTIVVGFIGTVFYMYSNTKLYNKEKKNVETKNVETTNVSEDIQMFNVNNNETTDNQLTDNLPTNNTETDLENIVNSKYKTLFENLLK